LAAQAKVSLHYDHVAAARTGILDAFVQCYAQAEAHGVGFEAALADECNEVALRAAFKLQRVAAWSTDSVLQRE